MDAPDLSVELAPRHKQGLRLRNPVMVASGTFSNGLEFARHHDVQSLGAIVSKGTTLLPRRGNPQRRTTETPGGMLNSIGFQNIGVERLVRDICPIWATWDVPVVVNILGDTVAEYARLAARLDAVPGVAGFEVNISCPNLDVGGIEFGVDPAAAASATRAVREHTSLPVVVKLTPNVTEIALIARAVAEAGADALCVANTIMGTAIDIEQRRPVLNRPFGGLSGPAVRPIILRMVWQVCAAVDIPVVASGGIMTWQDAVEYLLAGATAVQVGTATFVDPDAPWKVRDGIAGYLERHGEPSVTAIIGTARTFRRD